MNSQPTFPIWPLFNSMTWPYYQKDVNQMNLNYTTLWNLALPIFEAFAQILLNVNLSWHSCPMWDKLGWLNWFWTFLFEGLSSVNPKRFCYAYAWSCEGRTCFCTVLISRKLCGFFFVFDWLYFIRRFTSFSSIYYLLRLYGRFLMLFRPT